MPTISKFDGLTIVLYYNDHEPPPFHVYMLRPGEWDLDPDNLLCRRH